MDSRGWALVAVCLLSTCWGLPVQNVGGLEKNNTGDSEVPLRPNIFEIIIKENQGSSQLVQEGDIAVQPGRNARICRNNSCFWPKSSDGTVPVPYTLSATYSAEDLDAFKDAMSDFAKFTCIRFVTRTAEPNYLQIEPVDGCWSYVGKIGGRQQLSLAGECIWKGVIQHELNHALGFYHEHVRSDRDDYLTIMTENIAPEDLVNFNKENTNNLGLPYDYASVMHYGRYAYSNKRGQPSMVPKPDPDVPIGQRDGLSKLDVSKINTLYQCNLCSTLLTDPTGTLTSANNPSSYPNNVNCIYLIRVPSDTDKILLLFDAFDLQSSPDCTADYLTIYDGNNKTAPVLLSKACGTRKLQPFTSSGNEMLLVFVTDSSITANGFKASYSSVKCGGTFASSAGTVSSPYYPNIYRANMDCGFYLMAPTGYKVSLTFKSFALEAHPECAYDSLSIFDGANTSSPLIGKYCGSRRVPPVTSTGSSLLLQFHSDDSVNMKGFQATYTFGLTDLVSPQYQDISEQFWLECQNKDEKFVKLKKYLLEGWPSKNNVEYDLLPFYNIAEELWCEGDLFFKSEKCIPPSGVQELILKLAHKTHPGISAMKRIIRLHFWWPGMDRFIDRTVRECNECCNSDKMLKLHVPPLKTVKWPEFPWSKIAFDISGPFQVLPESSRFALVIVDYHSKWPEVKFVAKITSEVVISFFKEVFAREGCPSVLVSDNGVQLVSAEMKLFLQSCNIKHMCTSLYEPHENGQVERFNRVLKGFVSDAIKEKGDWLNRIRQKLWTYRITPHSTTEISPFKLLKGRDPASDTCPWWFKEKCEALVQNNVDVKEVAKRVSGKQSKSEVWYNKKWKTREHELCVGDWVRILKPFLVTKGTSKFGRPIQIKRVFSNSVVTQDGKVWNSGRVAKCPTQDVSKFQPHAVTDRGYISDGGSDSFSDSVASRIKDDRRIRRRPVSLQDFV
ncbi:uncharacterized protein LOC144826166 [Lissotriton helveticus]